MRRLTLILIWITLLIGWVWSLPEVDSSQFQSDSLQHGGAQRKYYVHLPSGYHKDKRWPVLFLFHGGGGSAPQALEHYPLLPLADREGFILVAVNGSGPLHREILRTWNVGWGFGYAQRNQVDDLGFVRALILQVQKDYAVDPKKVFLTGLSNGAILSHQAAAAHSDLIAGIAPVAGTVAGKLPNEKSLHYPVPPAHPVDVIIFHGTEDLSLPVDGGVQKKHAEDPPREIASARQSAEFWARANGCQSQPIVEELPDRQATRLSWPGGRARVVLYLIKNHGHAWPGGKAPRIQADPPSQWIKAHEVMWDFFRETHQE